LVVSNGSRSPPPACGAVLTSALMSLTEPNQNQPPGYLHWFYVECNPDGDAAGCAWLMQRARGRRKAGVHCVAAAKDGSLLRA
jgi:hypothetical protein